MDEKIAVDTPVLTGDLDKLGPLVVQPVRKKEEDDMRHIYKERLAALRLRMRRPCRCDHRRLERVSQEWAPPAPEARSPLRRALHAGGLVFRDGGVCGTPQEDRRSQGSRVQDQARDRGRDDRRAPQRGTLRRHPEQHPCSHEPARTKKRQRGRPTRLRLTEVPRTVAEISRTAAFTPR